MEQFPSQFLTWITCDLTGSKQFALNVLHAAQIEPQERVCHFESDQMVEVGFHRVIYITWSGRAMNLHLLLSFVQISSVQLKAI